MAKRPSISTISTDVAGLDTPLNANFSAVQDGFSNTLSRDGSTPNEMEADLDMNSNDILNAKDVYATRVYLNGSLLTVTDVSAISLEGRVAFDTKSLAEAATIDAAVNGFTILGYTDPGDGGRSSYKRVSSEPSHSLKIQSTDGAWWEIDEMFIYPEMAGAVGDGTTNDSNAFSAISSYLTAKGSGFLVLGHDKQYRLLSNFNIHDCAVTVLSPTGQSTDGTQLVFVGNAYLSLKRISGSKFIGLRASKSTADTYVCAFEQSTTNGQVGSSNVCFDTCQFVGGSTTHYITNVQNLRYVTCRILNTVGTIVTHLDGSAYDSTDLVGVRAGDNVDAVEFVHCTLAGAGSGSQTVLLIDGKADSTKLNGTAVLFGGIGLLQRSTGAALAIGEVPGFTYISGGGFENCTEEGIRITHGNRHFGLANAYISTDAAGSTDNIYIGPDASVNFHWVAGHCRAAGRNGVYANHTGTLQITGVYFDRNGVNATGDHVRIDSNVRLWTVGDCVMENSSGTITRHGVFINTTNPGNIGTITDNGLTGNVIENNATNVSSKVSATYNYDKPDLTYDLVVSGAVSTGYNRVARLPGGYYRLVVMGGLVAADSCTVRLYFTPAGGVRTAIGTGNITITTTESYTYLITDPEIDAANGGLLEVRVFSVTGSPTDLEVAFGLQRLIES